MLALFVHNREGSLERFHSPVLQPPSLPAEFWPSLLPSMSSASSVSKSPLALAAGTAPQLLSHAAKIEQNASKQQGIFSITYKSLFHQLFDFRIFTNADEPARAVGLLPSLFCKKCQKITPAFSSSSALFQKEYFANLFQIKTLFTLLQNRGVYTQSQICAQLLFSLPPLSPLESHLLQTPTR